MNWAFLSSFLRSLFILFSCILFLQLWNTIWPTIRLQNDTHTLTSSRTSEHITYVHLVLPVWLVSGTPYFSYGIHLLKNRNTIKYITEFNAAHMKLLHFVWRSGCCWCATRRRHPFDTKALCAQEHWARQRHSWFQCMRW